MLGLEGLTDLILDENDLLWEQPGKRHAVNRILKGIRMGRCPAVGIVERDVPEDVVKLARTSKRVKLAVADVTKALIDGQNHSLAQCAGFSSILSRSECVVSVFDAPHGSLADMIASKSPLKPQDVSCLMTAILQAASYCQRTGVSVSQDDLEPSNILVAKHSGDKRVRFQVALPVLHSLTSVLKSSSPAPLDPKAITMKMCVIVSQAINACVSAPVPCDADDDNEDAKTVHPEVSVALQKLASCGTLGLADILSQCALCGSKRSWTMALVLYQLRCLNLATPLCMQTPQLLKRPKPPSLPPISKVKAEVTPPPAKEKKKGFYSDFVVQQVAARKVATAGLDAATQCSHNEYSLLSFAKNTASVKKTKRNLRRSEGDVSDVVTVDDVITSQLSARSCAVLSSMSPKAQSLLSFDVEGGSMSPLTVPPLVDSPIDADIMFGLQSPASCDQLRDAVTALLSSMDSDQPSISAQLSTICVLNEFSQSTHCLPLLGVPACVRRIVRAVCHHPTSTKLVYTAAYTLFNIASVSSAKTMLLESGVGSVIRVLVNLSIQSKYVALAEVTWLLLEGFIKWDVFVASLVRSIGGDSLWQLLEVCAIAQDKTTVLAGFRVMSAITDLPQGLKTLTFSDAGQRSLAAAMAACVRFADVQLAAVLMLCNVCTKHPKAIPRLTTGPVVLSVLGAMESHAAAAKVQQACCGILCILAAVPASCLVLMRHNVAQCVVDAMATFPDHEGIQANGCQALSYLMWLGRLFPSPQYVLAVRHAVHALRRNLEVQLAGHIVKRIVSGDTPRYITPGDDGEQQEYADEDSVVLMTIASPSRSRRASV